MDVNEHERLFNINTMIAASEARTAYRLGHQSSPSFYSGGRVAQFLFFLSSVLWMAIAFSVL
jgi:hypothetical protein